MKPAPFALAKPGTLAEAQALARAPGARLMAGGQSLGPMLNLRLTTPDTIVPIIHLPDMASAAESEDAITLGAGITHAAIADGRTPDLDGHILARVAEGIAYLAVRNRGTIGGSLCHADPAADWLTVLTALDATVIIGPRSQRARDFVLGAFRVALAPGEIVTAIRIPRLRPGARWGYYKSCRKPGEFAHAMAAVLIGPDATTAVIGAAGGPPILLADTAPVAVTAALADSGLDPVAIHMQTVALRRAHDKALA